jgi:hypothetical protein
MEQLLKFTPDWLAPILTSLFIWYGVNYLIIAPVLYDRLTVNKVKNYADQLEIYSYFKKEQKGIDYMDISSCVYDIYFDDKRFYIALWTSTLSLYKHSELNRMKMNLMSAYKKSCNI